MEQEKVIKTKDNAWKKKLIFSSILLVFLVIYSISGVISGELGKKAAREVTSLKNPVQDVVDSINNELPMMIDPETRADSFKYTSEKRLVFKYTFIKRDKSEFDPAIIHGVFANELKKMTCSKIPKEIRTEDTNDLDFVLYDKDDLLVDTVTINLDQC